MFTFVYVNRDRFYLKALFLIIYQFYRQLFDIKKIKIIDFIEKIVKRITIISKKIVIRSFSNDVL